MNPLIQSKNTTILPVLIALTLGCFALSPKAQAICQDGCDTTNFNAFQGDDALLNNTTGNSNTAIGAFALTSNTSGSYNTATGLAALAINTTGSENTAIGWGALDSNTTGFYNTATGLAALQHNTTGRYNTADGYNALIGNTTGHFNTAIGASALVNNTGNNNIAVGYLAGFNLFTESNNIDIGHRGVTGESRRIRIGTTGIHTRTFIAGISGATVPSGVGVIVGSNGQLGTVVSSARFKDEIKPMDKASEAILALKPVTFRYKQELDPEGIPQFGLVAEEVEKVNPDLVARDADGKADTVRYEAVNAMLLNEFLKEHRKVEEQNRKIEEQQTTITQLKSALAKQETVDADQQKQIETLTAGLHKVSAQVQMSRPAPQVVNNP